MAALKKLKMFKKNVTTCFSNLNLSITDNFSKSAISVFFGKEKLLLTGAYLFGEPNACYFDRTPQWQTPIQNHSPKVAPERSCSEKFPNFHGIKPLTKSFLS